MYVHALMPSACGLSFICNKVLFAANTICHGYSLVIDGSLHEKQKLVDIKWQPVKLVD